ncbi:MAG: bifunctional allantoicase/(S)-ureidoglycine aminohydrolase [Pseudomonadota bacterium]
MSETSKPPSLFSDPGTTSATRTGPARGLPGQDALHTGRAVFTDAYAVIPRGVMRDIVTSRLPGWEGCRAWILARPMTGFAETFAQYIVELTPGGGSDTPEPEAHGQAALFVLDGEITLDLLGRHHRLGPGGFAYVPPWTLWSLRNSGERSALFTWIRKRWQTAEGLSAPDAIIAEDALTPPVAMPGASGWMTSRFMNPDDLRHDMHVNIVTFEPGSSIPFEETHVMEHGIYVLEGKAAYRLNRDWVEVEAGDFLWLRAFCPQACYAGGPGKFRYLLYKDVNRHPSLELGAPQ